MRESCTYGFVRGALSNERPYRTQSNGGPLDDPAKSVVSARH